MARVNSWIARKKFEDKAKVIEEVNDFDVSAKDDLFKLAKHCLLDETESALSLVKRLEKAKQISHRKLTEWPLFEDLRATPQMMLWLEQIESKAARRKAKTASKENGESNTNTGSGVTAEKPVITANHARRESAFPKISDP